MQEPLHEEKLGRFTLQIYHDNDPINPIKEYDNLGSYVCFHRRYDLGTVKFDSPEQALDYFKETQALFWPLYLMDHSGLSIRVDPTPFQMCDSAGWDWGQLGWVFITREKALKEFDAKILHKKLKERIQKSIFAEVNTYDQYLRGEVYGFVIEDEEREHEDSCWGFYGYDYCLGEAQAVLKHWFETTPHQLELGLCRQCLETA